jgi:hypothetical protein
MQRVKKYYKESDKLGCDLMDMCRRPVSIGIGLQTHSNCQNYMGELAHMSNLKFSLSSVWNLGASHIKTDVQIAYDIQSWCSWTR